MLLDTNRFRFYKLTQLETETLMRAVALIQREESRIAIIALDLAKGQQPGVPCPACGYIYFNPRCEYCRENRFCAEDVERD